MFLQSNEPKKMYFTHFQSTWLGCYALCGCSQYQGSETSYFHRSFRSHNLSQLHGLQWHLSRKQRKNWFCSLKMFNNIHKSK